MRKKLMFAGGAALLCGALLIGTPFCWLYSMETGGLVDRIVTRTGVPQLLLALAAAAGLYAMDAVKDEEAGALSFVPAIALALGYALATGTPVLWRKYEVSMFQMPLGTQILAAVLLIQCAKGICRSTRPNFSGRTALRSTITVTVLCAFSVLNGLSAGRFWLETLWMMLTGLAALEIVPAGRRGAGIVLTVLGAVGIALNFAVLKWTSSFDFLRALGIYGAAVQANFGFREVLSPFAFCLCGGIRALMPEKRA